jgi:hypothetical protein
MAPKTALKKSEKIEWIPQAIIRKPVSYFQKRLGLKFIEDSDNLDYFEGTLPARIGSRSFVLRHYRGFPSDVVGIYLPHDLTDESEIAKMVKKITERLSLPSSAISWQRGMSD